ncbi:MAG: class I SAM-dependent methyltransferase [Herpetosiphonaceae bacterium]|nr:class I SAM-dependent methyltransferase [Herpetosiphonaceae bacterium]
MFVNPAPTQAELTAFYQDPAYYKGGGLGYNDYFAQRESHETLADQRLKRIEKLLPAPGTVLDVGCAAGFFLAVAQKRGWTVAGVELSEDMAQYARDLTGQPIVPRVTELNVAPETFDAITFWEYIEHIPDPQDEVRRLTTLLKPGGVLALSTPNSSYWGAVYKPEIWREFKPPAHIGFFTAATLTRMLTACGLEVVALPRVFPLAPIHPYAARRLLDLLRRTLGNGAERRTPLWWVFSLAWRIVEKSTQMLYKWRWPDADIEVCIEAYARKPLA